MPLHNGNLCAQFIYLNAIMSRFICGLYVLSHFSISVENNFYKVFGKVFFFLSFKFIVFCLFWAIEYLVCGNHKFFFLCVSLISDSIYDPLLFKSACPSLIATMFILADVSVPTMWFNANSMSASMVCFGRSQILLG